MVEQGSLVLREGEKVIPLVDAYSLLASQAYGCSWDAFQTYSYLKNLGYIVGRYNVPWSFSTKKKQPPLPTTSASSDIEELQTQFAATDLANMDTTLKETSQTSSKSSESEQLKWQDEDEPCESRFFACQLSHGNNVRNSLLHDSLGVFCELLSFTFMDCRGWHCLVSWQIVDDGVFNSSSLWACCCLLEQTYSACHNKDNMQRYCEHSDDLLLAIDCDFQTTQEFQQVAVKSRMLAVCKRR
jgi:hypothetical protein